MSFFGRKITPFGKKPKIIVITFARWGERAIESKKLRFFRAFSQSSNQIFEVALNSFFSFCCCCFSHYY
jgi:hypothetical protein